MGGDRKDFFVSHAGADRAWAEWVAWQLTDAGYTVELDAWDWAVGQNFMLAMSDALARCARVLALFSPAYFERPRHTTEEWTAALVHVPGTGQAHLVPVRVENIPAKDMPAVLRPMIFCDLVGLDAAEARRVLLEAVQGPKRPDGEPVFPGSGTLGGLRKLGGVGPRLPGSLPRVWNLPARNPGFTGRDGLLMALREALVSGDRAVVQALQGIGGVGKTQLAIEYTYRFAGVYELAWWIDAEQAGLIGDHFAALGAALGCVEARASTERVRSAVLAELRARGRWLLVFDNAQGPGDVGGWLPGGGHVLITSRAHQWAEIATAIEVDVLARAESVEILKARVAGLTEAEAGQLAAQLGDLPLAIAQAAGYLAETGMPAADYLSLLQTHAGQILSQGRPVSYPRSLAAATQLAVDKLSRDDPAAAELVDLCAFLAPEPVPVDLFTGAAQELPAALVTRAADPIAWPQTLARVGRHALARIDHRGLVMHRLTQAIIRDRLTSDQAATTRKCTEAILAASDPADPTNPATWPRWAQLMPHLLATDLAATDNPAVRLMACNACVYLRTRGDTQSSHDLASDLRQHWSERLGGDHEHTRAVATNLASALREMRSYAEARDLDQDTLDRCRRILGADQPATLACANNLAIDLRLLEKVQAACELRQDTLDRMRRVLGADHIYTMQSASGLANDFSLLGEVHAARDLGQDTLDRMRRVLGADHPDTLQAAYNLAIYLRALGEVQAARDLGQDTLDRRRRVLGADHHYTLQAAHNLAVDLHALGEVHAARDLDQDILDRMRRVLSADHPDTLRSAAGLASHLHALGEVQAARDLGQDTLDRCRRVLGAEHPETVRAAANLIIYLRELGEADDGPRDRRRWPRMLRRRP